MPELPEVEITRRHLAPALTGRTLAKVSLSHPRTSRYNASPAEVEARLAGRQVLELRRHGKFLMGFLDDGQLLVAHLGMSGRFSITDPGAESELHTHFTAITADGREIRFIDPRTFGFVAVFDDLDESPVASLGPDAWEFPPDPRTLSRTLRGRAAPIKALLLDQTVLSGLGNIYADEVLHGARIHPLTPGGRIDTRRADRLLGVIREVLARAIEHGGTTLDDLAYLLPDGRAGENFERLSVYGRDDLSCPRCGSIIRKVVVRARSTHFCPSCQRSPRGLGSVNR